VGMTVIPDGFWPGLQAVGRDTSAGRPAAAAMASGDRSGDRLMLRPARTGAAPVPPRAARAGVWRSGERGAGDSTASAALVAMLRIVMFAAASVRLWIVMNQG